MSEERNLAESNILVHVHDVDHSVAETAWLTLGSSHESLIRVTGQSGQSHLRLSEDDLLTSLGVLQDDLIVDSVSHPA